MPRGRQRVVRRNVGTFKEWDGIPGISAAAAAVGTSLGGTLTFLRAQTLLRIRTNIYCSMDATQQIGDTMGITFGLGIFSTDAVTAGAGSVPDPSAEAEYPWIWWHDMFLRSEVAAAQDQWGTSSQFVQVDSKAMRKVKAAAAAAAEIPGIPSHSLNVPTLRRTTL